MTDIPPYVERIVAEALDGEVVTARHPTAGAVAETYQLDLADGRQVVCKLGGRSIWTGSVVEPLVVDLVGEHTTLPVPPVVATGSVTGLDSLDRWAVYGRLDGTVPRNLEGKGKATLVAAAGAMLGELHAVFTFDRIGGLVREGGSLRLVEPSPRNVFVSRPARKLRRRRDTPESFVLGHGDYQPGNLLVDDGAVTGVLDWGNAHVTEATYAFARAEARFVDLTTPSLTEREGFRERFRSAYRQAQPSENVAFGLVPAYKLLWLGQSARNLAGVASTSWGRTQLWRQLTNWGARTSKSIFDSPRHN
ncbi:MAG: aminoglycoside phosphotransferase family protein [Halovenus sp.]